ncbi:DUF5829 family protein [Flavobacterium sp. 25HG05S-40]|uniref:DUF5829 family protein n=1 Tax=Flavobacterium sp. 25HG05S-40 TaxID=3458682 RepID=UPI0040445E1C
MRIFYTLLLLYVPIVFFGQNKNTKLPLDLNTVFVTIDADSYSKLFDNSFVKDTLFLCRSSSTSTDKEDYTGKYLIGKAATIEFFSPMNTTMTGDTFGDVGIEFKTRKINQLALFENDKTKTETTFFQTDSLKIPWYKSVTVTLPSPHFEVSLLEYQKEYLSYMGFSEIEMTTEMTYDQYNAILSGGNKYPRKFNSISAIEVTLAPKELEYLIKSVENLGGTVNRETLRLNGTTIHYHVATKEHFRVNKIVLELTDEVPSKTIIISKNLTIKTKKKTAEIQFLY